MCAKQIDSSFIDPEMTTDLELSAAVSGEASIRSAEDLTFLKLNGTRSMTGNLNMDSNKITSLAEPISSNDATNKDFVERTAYYFAIVL